MTEYPGFWSRFKAWLIDSVIISAALLILLPVNNFAQSHFSLNVYSGVYLATAMIGPAYFVLTQKRWGWTVGKRVVGIKLCMRDGSQLKWSAAVIRYSPSIALILANSIGWTTAASMLRPEVFSAATIVERGKYISMVAPAWWDWLSYLFGAWYFINVIVLRNSLQSRALHDIIAGTLVCYAKPRKMRLRGV